MNFVWILVLSTFSLAVADKRCASGESFWCSSLENAKLCGAIDHCRTTVWTNQVLATDSTEVCQFCETIVADVLEYIKKSKTESEISQFMSNACNLVPDKTTSSECKLIVQLYLPEIIDLISNKVKPQVVCNLIHLCKSLPESSSENLDTSLTEKSTDSMQCILCEFVIKELKTLIGDHATEDKIIAALEKVCKILPSTIRDSCNSFIELYGKEILDLLLQDVSPEQICTSIHLCKAMTVFDFSPYIENVDGILTCEVCEYLVKIAENFLDENSTIQEIEKIVMKVCNVLPNSMKLECSLIVQLYGDNIIEFIAKAYSPKQVCTLIKLCPQTIEMEKLVRAKTGPIF